MENKIVVVVKGILLKGGKALIVKRADDDTGGGTWEFSGGKIEFGESLEDALKREYLEETGVNIEVSKILYVTSFKTNVNRQVVLISYLCNCDDCHSITLSFEHSEYMWANRGELKKRLSEGIVDDIERNDLWEIFSET